MAIFVLTASKATPRKGIRYIMDKDKMELWRAWNLDPNADLAQQMIDTQRLWKKGTGTEERKYYHLKIAFSPKDRKEKGGVLTKNWRYGLRLILFIENFRQRRQLSRCRVTGGHGIYISSSMRLIQ